MAGLKEWLRYKYDPMAFDQKPVKRPNQQVVRVELPFGMLCQQGVSKRYLEFLRAHGFEIPDDTTYVVELDGTFNDLWWISHVCVLRYMWEYPDFVQKWEHWCDVKPEWDPWVIFVTCHMYEGSYNSNHALMHSNMSICPNPKETLKILKENPTSLEGNSKGIHKAWVSVDWNANRNEPMPGSFEDRYQYFLERQL